MRKTSLLFFLNLSLFAVPLILIFNPPDIYGVHRVVRYFQIAVPAFLAWLLVDLLLSRRRDPDSRSVAAIASRMLRAARRNYRLLSRPGRVLFWGVAGVLFVVLLKTAGLLQSLFNLITQPLYMVAIFFALAPVTLLATAGFIFLSLLVVRRIIPTGFFRRWWILGFYGCWLTVCAALGYFHYFKMGPSDTTCENVFRAEGLVPLYKIGEIRDTDGLRGSMPYDLVADPQDGFVFVSLKRTDGVRGGIAKVDLSGQAPEAMIRIDEQTSGVRLFPERMAVDPETKEVYTLLLGSPRHKLHVASYRDGGWREEKTLPLPGEPNHILYDEKQGTVVVFFAGSDVDGLAVFRSDTGEMVRRIGSEKIVGCTQFAVTDRPHGKSYFTNIGFSPLYEADEGLKEILRKKTSAMPLVGIAVQQDPHRLYVSSPMTRDVKIADPETLRFIGRLKTNGGLAEIEIDEERGRLYVADYGGDLSVYTLDDHRLLERFFLGRMLRSIHLDEETGRLFACSGCGVFEILPVPTGHAPRDADRPTREDRSRKDPGTQG